MIGYINPSLFYLTLSDDGGYADKTEVTVNLHKKSDGLIVAKRVFNAAQLRGQTGYSITKQVQDTREAILLQAAGKTYFAGSSVQSGLQQLMHSCYNTMWATGDHSDVDNRDGTVKTGYERAYAGRFVDPDYLTGASDKATASHFVAWMVTLSAQELSALYGD